MPSRSSSASKQAKLPTIGKGSTNAKKSSSTNNTKPKGKPNASILSFFKKDDGLFVAGTGSPPIKSIESVDVVEVEEDQDSKFNEDGGAVKRRKLSPTNHQDSKTTSPVSTPIDNRKPTTTNYAPSVPFVEESDSEDDDAPQTTSTNTEANPRPPLIHQPTSASVVHQDTFGDFEATDDFEDDVFDEGEEYVERLWAEQEQMRLEMGGDDSFQDDDENDNSIVRESDVPSCPICSINLAGVAESDAGIHVNNCLDGNPTPLPEKKDKPPPTAPSPSRFKKSARPPKPGQSQPSTDGEAGASAFAKLMTGRSEDVAWANAAAAEQSSRGKPSYTRTCPFYKILPGTNICVDAFRYGAVAGCNAYFLSHFHSDHYVGLSSTWSHGPIYCSRVTANLVRQQLRVDPQYVIPLEWEEKTEVPGTPGVTVTMISANHCPGSSLFLFEKPLSKGPDPKLQRILHCGDFRACKMHVQHPLLRPDVQDHVTGKTKDQKIDVCYLDTTYLNPKYAFPEQEDVIRACSELCVELNESPTLDTVKRDISAISTFVRKDSQPSIKEEASDSKIKQEPDDEKDLKLYGNGKLTSTKSARLLVVVGTYSIGKERICIGIAKALKSKIYAPPNKQRICRALEDPELSALLTTDPREAQVHMTPIFEIRADTLDEYRIGYADAFDRCVGFRPSGWNYRPPTSRGETPNVQNILYSSSWKSSYTLRDLSPQRGSTKKAACYGVPYSEHSSFRELTMFCTALRIEKIIPTVNVGSAKSRERMKVWADRWIGAREKNGCFDVKDW